MVANIHRSFAITLLFGEENVCSYCILGVLYPKSVVVSSPVVYMCHVGQSQ